MSLPLLPHPVYHIVSQGELVGYTSVEQTREYGQQCREAALEEAARLCDRRSKEGSPPIACDEAGLIAEQIRNLK